LSILALSASYGVELVRVPVSSTWSQCSTTKKHVLTMKKLIAMLTLTCVAALATNAADEAKDKKADPHAELKTQMLAKYDANKDGKLDNNEMAKMSAEDRAKWVDAFGKKKEAEAKKEEPKKEEKK
jgi:hypothetical protein